MDQLVQEFKRQVNEEMTKLKDSISSGMLDDMNEYKRLSGHLHGLKEALDIIDAARSKILKT